MIRTRLNTGGKSARLSHHPVRITALLYLKEALIREQYEKCAELIAAAKEFGATPREVQYLLEDPRRSPT